MADSTPRTPAPVLPPTEGLGQTLDLEPTVPPQAAAAVVPPVPIPGYEVEAELGRGGMGVVYLAYQPSLKRRVALKTILVAGGADADTRRRFRAEAEATARLQHPNIVQVFEVGEVDGHLYYAMEYVDGGSLAGRAVRPPHEAARLAEALADAVQHAHDRGVVHRDLKPANV
ncbi:MAG TPA: serine/threonine-protein kinase, partial [Gemmataceae bacterium]